MFFCRIIFQGVYFWNTKKFERIIITGVIERNCREKTMSSQPPDKTQDMSWHGGYELVLIFVYMSCVYHFDTLFHHSFAWGWSRNI